MLAERGPCRSCVLFLLAVGFAGVATAQQPRLLRDIDTRPAVANGDSDVPGGGTIRLGSSLLFAATTVREGPELFRTGGIPGDASVVRETVPGRQDGPPPAEFARLGTRVLYSAFDFRHGAELWATDGSSAGTQRIADIRPGPEGSRPRALATLGNRVVFTADDGVHGREPWVTDGTAAGTRLLSDTLPGAAGGIFIGRHEVATFAGRAWFAADDGTGPRLWWSDGTPAGTARLPVSAFSPMSFTVVGARMFFSAVDSTNGPRLFVTDGTLAGTRSVARLAPGNTTFGRLIVPFGTGVVFLHDDGVHGQEPWISDGTAAGTRMILDLWSGPGHSRPLLMGERNGWFFLAGAERAYGRELFRTDGTAAGTSLVADVWPGPGLDGVPPTSEFAFLGDRLVFSAIDGRNGHEPWITDGTPAGTSLLADIRPGKANSTPTRFTSLPGGGLMFFADDGVRGREPWFTDGTRSGTKLLTDLNRPPAGATASSSGREGHVDSLRGFSVFAIDDGVHGTEPWITDGTTAGTRLLADIRPGRESSVPEGEFVVLGSRVFFAAWTPDTGVEMWSTDGTATGTRLVRDTTPGPDGTHWRDLTPVPGGRLIASAYDSLSGREPWAFFANGHSQRLGDVRVPSSSNPDSFLQSGDRFFFTADDRTHGRELWAVDGDLTGLRLVIDLEPGEWDGLSAGALDSGSMLEIGGRILFGGRSGRSVGLWVTDGTGLGTRSVVTIPDSSVPRSLARHRDDVWFIVRAAGSEQVWHTTVAATGAAPLAFLATQFGVLQPKALAIASGKLVVLARDAEGGALWATDGTASGTVRLTAAGVAVDHDAPELLSVGSRRAYFRASTQEDGSELWVTDGTVTGTRQVADLAPGASSSTPTGLTVAGGRLYFDADDGVHGREPFVLDLGAVSTEVGVASGFGERALPRLETDDPVLGASMQVRGFDANDASIAALGIGLPSGEIASWTVLCQNSYVAAPSIWSVLPVTNGAWTDSIPVPLVPSLAGATVALQAWTRPGRIPSIDCSNGVYVTLGF